MAICNSIYRVVTNEDGTKSIGAQVFICGTQSGEATDQLVSVKFYDGSKDDFDADTNASDFLAGIDLNGIVVFQSADSSCQELYRVAEVDGNKVIGDKLNICLPAIEAKQWTLHYGGSKEQFEADAKKDEFIANSADGSVIYFYNYENDDLKCVEAYRIDHEDDGSIVIGDRLYPCADNGYDDTEIKAQVESNTSRIEALEAEECPVLVESYAGFVEDMPQSIVDDMDENALISAFVRDEDSSTGDGSVTLTPEEYQEFLKLKFEVAHLSIAEIEVTVGGDGATDDVMDYHDRDKTPFLTYLAAYQYLIGTYHCNLARIMIEGEVNYSADGNVDISNIASNMHHFGIFELYGTNMRTSILTGLALPCVSNTSIGNLTLRLNMGLMPVGGISTGLVMINDKVRIESDYCCIWAMAGGQCVVNNEIELVSTSTDSSPTTVAVNLDSSKYVSYAMTRIAGPFSTIFNGVNMSDFNLASSTQGYVDGLPHATGKKYELSNMSRLLAGEQMQFLPGSIDGTLDSTCVVA